MIRKAKVFFTTALGQVPDSPLMLIHTSLFYFKTLGMNFVGYGHLGHIDELGPRFDYQFLTYRLAKDAQETILQAEVRI